MAINGAALRLNFMDEPDREDRAKSYIWALRGGPVEAPVVLFHSGRAGMMHGATMMHCATG